MYTVHTSALFSCVLNPKENVKSCYSTLISYTSLAGTCHTSSQMNVESGSSFAFQILIVSLFFPQRISELTPCLSTSCAFLTPPSSPTPHPSSLFVTSASFLLKRWCIRLITGWWKSSLALPLFQLPYPLLWRQHMSPCLYLTPPFLSLFGKNRSCQSLSFLVLLFVMADLHCTGTSLTSFAAFGGFIQQQ